MGLFDGLRKILDPGSIIFDEIGGDAEEWYDRIADPMDLFGEQAKGSRNTIDKILRGATDEGLAAARESYNLAKGYQQPYLDYSLASLSSLYEPQGPSLQYQRDLDRGTRAIDQGLAARGLRNSSFGQQQYADFLVDLGQEETRRQWGNRLNDVKIGTGAADSIGGAAGNFGSAGSSLYSNLGQGLNSLASMYGQQRAASYQGAGNAIGNLGAFFGSR